MAKENPDRDFDEERADLHARYVNGIATHYLKHAKKNKDDTFFDGRPITTTTGLVARAVIDLVGDRTRADMLDVEKVERRDMQDIVEEIISQGVVLDAVDTVVNRMRTPDKPNSSWVQQSVMNATEALNAGEVNQAVRLAHHWGTREELTPLERCHGLGHALYQQYGMDGVTITAGDTVIADAGSSYAKTYDQKYADQIKARQIKAAKDLFGD